MIPRTTSGRHRAVRRTAAVLLLAGLAVGLGSLTSAVPAQQRGAVIEVIEVQGIVDRTVAGYLEERIEQAAVDDADVLVLSIDTPGGLGVSVDQVVEAMVVSEVPVVVWVGPSGARATSAGMYLASASHVLAMAPATTLGAPLPADLGGGEPDRADRDAAEQRLVALAELRGRDTDFARRAVRDGAVVAIGETALPPGAELPPGIDRADVRVVSAAELQQRPVADLVASSLPELFTALDGHEVELTPAARSATTRTLAIDQATATIRFNNMGLLRRVLHTVANPTLAYLLLIAGALTLLFEVFQPGFGVAGVTGIVLLALALYGAAVLPVNWLGFGLIVLGLALLAADLAIAGLGPLTAGGTVALTAGSLLLFGADALRLSPWLVVPVVAFNVVFFVVIMTTVLRAQSSQAMAGAEGMQGKVGVVRSVLNPEGHVFVGGALWRARAPEHLGKVKTGTRVRVLGVNDRLTLDVDVVDSDAADQTPVG